MLYPFSRDCPAVVPAETPGRYVVVVADRRQHPDSDAAGALALVPAELTAPRTLR